MKIPVPHDLTRAEAYLALRLLERLIDALIAFDHAIRRAYGINEVVDDDIPF